MEQKHKTVMVDTLSDMLLLEPLHDGCYVGRHFDFAGINLYGGQMVCQAMIAAQHEVDQWTASAGSTEAQQLQSLHGYFLEPGNKRLPVCYHVDTVRNGRTFSSRHITATQSDASGTGRESSKTLFEMLALFQKSEGSSFQHQAVFPRHLPAPETLPDELTLRRQWLQEGEAQLAQLWGLPALTDEMRDRFLRPLPMDIRFIDPVNPLLPKSPLWDGLTPPPELLARQYWFRFPDSLVSLRSVNRAIIIKAMLAYVSDYGLMGVAMKPHGLSFLDRQVKSTSLDHAVWFHQPDSLEGWFLYQIDSVNLSQARGLSQGKIFDQDGRLVATTAQEGLVRLRRQP